jgi:hypothetical protein
MSANAESAAAQSLRVFAWAAFTAVARKRVRWCLLHRPWEVPSATRDWLQARRYARTCSGPQPTSLSEFLADESGW